MGLYFSMRGITSGKKQEVVEGHLFLTKLSENPSKFRNNCLIQRGINNLTVGIENYNYVLS